MKKLIAALLLLTGTITRMKGKSKADFTPFLSAKKEQVKTITFTEKDGTVHTITNAVLHLAQRSEDKINGVGTILYTLLEQGNGKKATVFFKMKSLELADTIAELGDTTANALQAFNTEGVATDEATPVLSEDTTEKVAEGATA